MVRTHKKTVPRTHTRSQPTPLPPNPLRPPTQPQQQRTPTQVARQQRTTPATPTPTQRNRNYRNNPVPPTTPTNTSLVRQWKDAFNAAGRKVATTAKQAATPQGMAQGARAVGRATVKGVKVAGDATYKGMKWVEEKRQDAEFEREEKNTRRMERWQNLPAETRQELIDEQAQKKQLEHKLKVMRQQFEDAQADKTEAIISGRKYQPKIFKIQDAYGEEKFVDEYGREVQDPGTEVMPKKRGGYGSSYGSGYGSGFVPQAQPQFSQRTEMNDVEDLLGMGFRPERRPAQQPQQPQQRQEQNLFAEGRNQFASSEDEPRRRQHREQPQQYSQPQLPPPPQQQGFRPPQPTRRRNFQSDEDEELRMFRDSEQESLNFLLGGY
jgi:hypothetical protein